MRRLSTIRPLSTVLRQRRVERVVAVFLRSRTVRERVRFVLRELPERRVLAQYALARSGLPVFVRHGTPDIVTLDEVFYQEIYAFPDVVMARLRTLGRPPKVLDLGANIGLFGVFALGELPGGHVTAVEADPANVSVLLQCAAANSDRGEWEVIEAAASNRDGTLSFAAGAYSLSHVAAPDEPGRPVPAQDAVPPMARADLVKMDIEGGEWAILSDPRLEAAPPPALVLEYHTRFCPEPDPRAAAVRALERIGMETRPFDERDGHGMVWAWRAG
jgi:FkbM family methyltransferase